MPRPWSDVVQALYPWLVCLVSALALLALCVAGGCGGDAHGWRQAEEHPPGGAWYSVGDVLPAHDAMSQPLYLLKVRTEQTGDPRDALPAGVDGPEVAFVIGNAPLDNWQGATGTSLDPFALCWGYWAHEPLPQMAGPALYRREYTDATASDWRIVPNHQPDPPCHVLVYEAEPGRIRMGLWW